MRRIFSLQRIGSLLALAVLVAGARPITVTALASTGTQNTGSAFCSNLSTRQTAVQAKATNLKSKIQTAWQNQDTKLQTLTKQQDDKVAAVRANVDKQRQQNFNKLEAKASTASEKTAVSTYETTMTDAASVRRASVDDARANFQASLKTTVESRRAALSVQLGTLSDALTSAFAVAADSCQAGTDPATVRATLVASLQTARQTFQSERQNDDKVREDVRTLADTRRTSVTAANDRFTTAATQARQTLKQAFGADASKI